MRVEVKDQKSEKKKRRAQAGGQTQLAINKLQVDIVAGILKPNEKLAISRLCERYAIGPSAVREALARLAGSNLVNAEDRRGFYVAPVSAAEVVDLHRTLRDVDALALRRAIQRADSSWEANLLGVFHQVCRLRPPDARSSAVETQETYRLYAALHHALISGCGSRWLVWFCDTLFEQTERYRNLYRFGRSDLVSKRDAVAEWRAIIEAVLARDVEAACRKQAEYFETTTQILLKSFGQPPPSARKRVSTGRSVRSKTKSIRT